MIDKYINNIDKRKHILSEYLELKLIYGDYKYYFTNTDCIEIDNKYYNIFNDLDNKKFIVIENSNWKYYDSSYNIYPKIIIDDMTEIITDINYLFNYVRCVWESKLWNDISTRTNKDWILCYIGNELINQLLLNTDIWIKKLEDWYLIYNK